jgi:hypothetical protein
MANPYQSPQTCSEGDSQRGRNGNLLGAGVLLGAGLLFLVISGSLLLAILFGFMTNPDRIERWMSVLLTAVVGCCLILLWRRDRAKQFPLSTETGTRPSK